MTNVDWALAYAETYRLVVLPLWPGLKAVHSSRRHPERALLGSGFSLDIAGTTDPDVIRWWWGRCPDAGVGIVCGARSRLLVIDVDNKRHDGEAELERWLGLGERNLRDSSVVLTPSNGYHLWFRLPHGIDVRSVDGFLPGVDVLGSGHWAAAPPTYVRDRGASYAWLRNGGPIPEAPGWLIDAVRSGRGHRSSLGGGDGGRGLIPNEPMPEDAFFIAKGLGGWSGSRGVDAYRLAWRCWCRYRAEREVVAVLYSAWNQTDKDDFPWREVYGRIASARDRRQRQLEDAIVRYQP